jgi:signal transduction histidine kinase
VESPGPIRSLFSFRGNPSTWDATAYLATDLLVAVPAFTLIVTGLALSAGLAITFFLALPCAWATIWSARLMGAIERWRLWAFLGRDVPAPPVPVAGTWFGLLKANARSRATWRQVGHALVQLPVACVTFTLVTVAWAVPLVLIAMPAYISALPSQKMDFWIATARPGWVPFALAILGVVLLPAAALAMRHGAPLRARMSAGLLAPTAADALKERVTRLETTRSRVVDAADDERRRIERDLHDGAQQRLIALAMDLGMAREKFTSDPEQARVLIDEAHDEAKRAIVELRDLARGIHPAVLTDRGLAAALASVASRSPVPVDLRVDLDERPPATIEGIAYFVVTEALANVAKHAEATTARVTIAQRGSRLVLEVSDNGAGGADPANGTGLAGLTDRVAAVDGWMHVTSPVGGPTTLTVELPCGS